MFWSPTGGGVRRYLQTKHAWLAGTAGWRHTIAVPMARGAVAAAPPGFAALPALPIPGSDGYRLPWRRGALADRLEALAPDVIEVGDPFRLAWAARDAAARLGVPALACCHSNIEAMARLFGGPRFGAAAARAARRYARRVYRDFDAVLAPSDSMRRHLVEWGVERAVHQPLGVDTAAFHPGRRSAAWREPLGLGPAERVLVYVGRFAPEKHLDVLAAAVDRLGPPYRLLAVGAGPRPPSGTRVRVLPFVASVDALATLLASADAFVHAGDQETFGLSVLEAMASGLPVVGRGAEGLAELIDDAVGVAVAAGTPEAFAEAIAALFAADLEPKRQAARRRAEAHDWNRVLPMLLERYRTAIGRDATTETAAPTLGRTAHASAHPHGLRTEGSR